MAGRRARRQQHERRRRRLRVARAYQEPRAAAAFADRRLPEIRSRIATAAGRVVADLRRESVRLDRAGVEQWLCALAQARSVLVSREHRLDAWSAEEVSASNDALVLTVVQDYLIEAVAPRVTDLAHRAFAPH
ncbi:MAG: hypothetical protein HOV94_35865 [Saccharothrix sp.]|nr:hypothetical protein [Saccharothrix sp.]